MLYIETTVLYVYTLAKDKEPERFEATLKLIEKINAGELHAMTSFYTLMELYALATVKADSWENGVREAKACLMTVLNTDILITGMLSREERFTNEWRFRMVSDSSDVSHAISAYLHNCQQFVTYDSHFDGIAGIMGVIAPEKLLAGSV